ncbi:Kelch domain-containing protein 1 [Thelohanellus kitauei]|uniref:Kelch domain-containing protein 1 n=1 Tax=Thelohanellus kitauei TaxID=669202 RepID=A0A0C2JPA0_THEKT|nr:Kelch domain-containing protein 1 [Thelohanellus kitauei]
MNLRNDKAPPKSLSGYCVTSIREFLIIYGGYDNKERADCNELWSYNTISDVWNRYQTPIEIKDTPTGSSICAVKNLIYIFGGQRLYDNYRHSNSLISFDITSSTWNSLYPHTGDYDENTPPPMYATSLYFHNGSLYVLGGCHYNSCFVTIYQFTLKTSTWSLVEQNGPETAFWAGGIFRTVFKNQLYCFGSSLRETDRFRDVVIFDFLTRTWTTRPTNSKTELYPCDRTGETFAFSTKFGFLSGGGCLTGFYTDIWKIDLETLEWSKMDYNLNAEIMDHNMCIVDETYLYVYGGLDTDLNDLDSMERFTLKLPTLYRLGLESVCRSPNRTSYVMSLPSAILDELNLVDNDSLSDV